MVGSDRWKGKLLYCISIPHTHWIHDCCLRDELEGGKGKLIVKGKNEV